MIYHTEYKKVHEFLNTLGIPTVRHGGLLSIAGRIDFLVEKFKVEIAQLKAENEELKAKLLAK